MFTHNSQRTPSLRPPSFDVIFLMDVFGLGASLIHSTETKKVASPSLLSSVGSRSPADFLSCAGLRLEGIRQKDSCKRKN